jgi:hypothetical protein
VKQAIVTFEPSSIYGSRLGFQEVVLVTANDPKNIAKSSLWKQGLAVGVSMLPRQAMVKPCKSEGKWGSDSRFTKVQEMKQDWGSLKIKLSVCNV